MINDTGNYNNLKLEQNFVQKYVLNQWDEIEVGESPHWHKYSQIYKWRNV